MKKFFWVYKYYFILSALIIFSILAGFFLGLGIGKHSEQTKVLEEKQVISVETPTFVPEITDGRTSLGEFKLTGYCICSECCGGYSDGLTATMTNATPGRTIAVDPDVIPYGSIVEINGNEYIAEDCGKAIKGNHIDILCASHELAEAFGVQYAEVYLVNNSAEDICQ